LQLENKYWTFIGFVQVCKQDVLRRIGEDDGDDDGDGVVGRADRFDWLLAFFERLLLDQGRERYQIQHRHGVFRTVIATDRASHHRFKASAFAPRNSFQETKLKSALKTRGTAFSEFCPNFR
jgi:hypothetical protein